MPSRRDNLMAQFTQRVKREPGSFRGDVRPATFRGQRRRRKAPTSRPGFGGGAPFRSTAMTQRKRPRTPTRTYF